MVITLTHMHQLVWGKLMSLSSSTTTAYTYPNHGLKGHAFIKIFKGRHLVWTIFYAVLAAII